MNRRKDLTGLKVNRLTVVRFSGRVTSGCNAIWECRCDCGGTRFASSSALKSRQAVSCGCSLRTQFLCSIPGCKNQAKAKHLCNRHYKRSQRPMKYSHDIHERFSEKTKRLENGCLEWTGTVGEFGYGQTSWRGKKFNTHRLAWVLANGEIPAGLFVCHRCDNPKCVAIEHLFLGTQKDNIHDAISKGRMAFQKAVAP